MNTRTPNQDPPEDVDELYRRASAQDPSEPGEAVRRAVLGHAARLAAERTAAMPPSGVTRPRPAAARRPWRHPVVFGTLAAAALAGLAVAPRYLVRNPSPAVEQRSLSMTGARSASPPAPVAPRPAAAPAPETAFSARDSAAEPARARPDRLQRDARERPQLARSERAEVAQSRARRESASGQREALSSVAVTAAKARVAAPEENRVAGYASVDEAAAAPAAADPTAALRHAAEVGDLAALQSLLTQQTDINARDAAGRTALMLAIRHGRGDAVSALLAAGADPNAADSHGITPLQAAAADGQWAMAATLQRYGAR